MSYHREAKHVQRAIRTIPVDEVALRLATFEGNDGRYCIVADYLEFIHVDDRNVEITWDNSIEIALIDRYVRSRPERIHPTRESAIAFVTSQISK